MNHQLGILIGSKYFDNHQLPSDPKSYHFYNLKFNVLVADCEGFLETFFDENPELYEELNLIIYERDNDGSKGGRRIKCNYNKIENNLKNYNFNQIACHCYGTKDLVWSKNR